MSFWRRVMLKNVYIWTTPFLALWNEFIKILYVKQTNLPSKVEKSRVTLFTELLVLLTLGSPHSFYHFFIQLHWRRKRLRIPTQNISKVYVEEFAWMLIRNSFVSRIIFKNWEGDMSYNWYKQCLFIKNRWSLLNCLILLTQAWEWSSEHFGVHFNFTFSQMKLQLK